MIESNAHRICRIINTFVRPLVAGAAVGLLIWLLYVLWRLQE